MRPIARLAAATLVATAACSGGSAAPVADATLERDLKLASTTSFALAPMADAELTQLETAPKIAEEPAPRPRAATSGPRRVRSERPAVTAEPIADVAADDAEGAASEAPQPIAEESTPAVSSTDVGVALPRPVPAAVVVPGAEGQGMGDVGAGRGPSAGEVLGGVFGVVLRGGGVGGVDDCEIHDRRGRRTSNRPGSPGVGVGSGRWPSGEGRRPPQRTTDNGGRAGVWRVGTRN